MLYAQLGYFEENRNADSVCVLVVNFAFKNDPKLVRRGCKSELDVLEKTFVERKCGYKLLESPYKNYLLSFLSDDQKLAKLFEISGPPSVFILFFLSYGNGEGTIFTDHKGVGSQYETFATREVTEALKKLQEWRNVFKIVSFVVHPKKVEAQISFYKQGLFAAALYPKQLTDNGTAYSNFPRAKNFVVIFSTEEKKNEENGDKENLSTSFVQTFCKLLNELAENFSLSDFLTALQGRMEQPPEVVYTSHDPLTFYKSSIAIRKVHERDASLLRKDNLFYPWISQSGEPLRKKVGLVYGEEQAATNKIERALQEKLGFETRKITRLTDCMTNKVHSEQGAVGCFLACFLAPLFVDKEKRICLRMKNQNVSIWDVANFFATPRDSSWTKRPKIFFFVNEVNNSESEENKLCDSVSIKTAHHSGILFCTLNGKDSVHRLEELLSLPALRNGSANLEELLLRLLRQEGEQTGRICSKVVSTLPFLLDFPIWPSVFIPPTYNVTVTARLSKEKLNPPTDGSRSCAKFISSASADLTFFQLRDEFEAQFLRQKMPRPYCVWIISSPPGSGKTVTVRKLESYAAFKQEKVHVVNLVHHYQYLKSAAAGSININEILANVTSRRLGEEKPITVLEGFDEICPELREKGLMLIRSMANSQVPLVISTRPHEFLSISNAIESIPSFKIKVLPLDGKKQLDLLMQISSKNEKKCRLMIDHFSKLGFSDVLQSPLHLALISNFVESVDTADDFDYFEVYKALVDEKLRDAVKNKDKIGEGHCKCESSIKIGMALSHKLARHVLLREPAFSFTEEKIAIINSTGIASITGPDNVEFFHKSVAEFLVADSYLYDIKVKQASSIPMFEEAVLKPCRGFINSFFSQRSREHDEDSDNLVFYLKSNKETVKTILQTAAREGLVHIFKIALLVIMPFRNCPPPKEFESDVYMLLETACESSEEIAIRILKTGVLKHLDRGLRPEKICRLTEKIASANMIDAYKELKRQCDDLEVILKRSKNVQAVLKAVKNGHVEMMQQLLESGIDTEIRDENGLTALIAAAKGCESQVAQFLLNKYADLNSRDAQGRSCLFYAAYGGRLETVEILVRENQELLRDVLNDGSTVLHYAVRNEDVAVFRFLAEKGVKRFEAADGNGWNVFHAACAFGNLQHAEYVLEKWVVTSDFDFFQDSEAEVLKRFVNLRTDEGQTPLMLAAYASGAEMCSFLVVNGADLTATDKIGNNAAHYAVAGGKLDALKCLLEIDPQIKDRTGHESRTLLHQAVAHRKLEIVRFLIEKGADVNARDANSATPLHYSCQIMQVYRVQMCSFFGEDNGKAPTAIEKSSFKIFKLLRDTGAALHLKNVEGNTALHCAAFSGLLNNAKGILHKDKARVNEKNSAGRTPLHMACAKGHLPMVNALLRYGANVNARDKYRSTPLTLTAQHSSTEVLAFLIKCGANVRAKDQDGENALHCACRGGKLDNVKLLTTRNDFSAKKKNARKMTALEIALERGHRDVAEYLQSIPKPEEFPLLMQVITLWT